MNTAKKDIEKLNIELKNAKWDDMFIDENPDFDYDTFLNILTSLINTCLHLLHIMVSLY